MEVMTLPVSSSPTSTKISSSPKNSEKGSINNRIQWIMRFSLVLASLAAFQCLFHSIKVEQMFRKSYRENRIINDRILSNGKKSIAFKIPKDVTFEKTKKEHKMKVSKGATTGGNVKPKKDTLEASAPLLNFYIAGFPKCGTTTLLYAFNKHNETAISSREFCALDRSKLTYRDALNMLNETLSDLRGSKRGVKCPMSVHELKSIRRLDRLSPNTKLIVGVRHPVLFFESFYNYRITEMYNKNEVEVVPRPEMLIHNSWRRVTTNLARFELSLMQLGKTDLSKKELELFMPEALPSKIYRSSLSLFLYNIDQLGDDNDVRANQFRSEMQYFLGLKSEIAPFPRENVGWKIKKFSEHIDICEEKHEKLRRWITMHARKTKIWFKNYLMSSNKVVIGGRAYFLQLMESWDKDPCVAKKLK